VEKEIMAKWKAKERKVLREEARVDPKGGAGHAEAIIMPQTVQS